MKRITFIACILLLVALLALGATAFADDGDNILEIQVSPHTLNLASYGGTFSIHADASYNSVDYVALTVDGKPLLVNHTGTVAEGDLTPDCHTFADDLGNLVVKCNLETVKEFVTEGKATFTLVVTLKDGSVLTNSETIDVVEHGYEGNGGGRNGDCACDGNGDGECDGSGGGPQGPGGKH